ncbi:hypothetical protein [Novosphingobium sp.]|uniref:hypothetical protein n=1 Tax=Novosphingobium sp. TaxID=1874826 RepID=UPI003BAAEF66
MKRLFGGLLQAAGILIMLTSGLCTVAVIGMTLTEVVRDPSMIAAGWVPLLFGGIPFMAGFGLFRWGRSLRREHDHNVF